MFLAVLVKYERRVGYGLEWFPGGILGFVVSNPFDKKLYLSLPGPICKNIFDLVLNLVVDDFRLWGWLRAMIERFR